VIVALVAALLAAAAPIRADEPKPLDLYLEKLASYIGQFIYRFSNVVAEEDYLQETSSPRRKRTLKSDLLLVHASDDEPWMLFRDVIEVDGKPVDETRQRLVTLLSSSPQSTLQRARELTQLGARYNLANIGTLNHPLVVLTLNQRMYRDRFRYTYAGIDKKLGPTVRTVQFQEIRTPTIITLDGNGDVATRGLISADETTGVVLRTELLIGRQPGGIRIVTTFRPDEELGIAVPVKMEETYPDRTGDITGSATYGHFRRFQVKTDETVK
jgi:hypothetical protein